MHRGFLTLATLAVGSLVPSATAYAAPPIRLACDEVTTTGLGPTDDYRADSKNYRGRVAVVVTEKTIELMTWDHVASGVTEPDKLAVLASSSSEVLASRVFATDIDVVAVNIEKSAVLWTRVRPAGSQGRPMQWTVVYACKAPL